MNLTNMILAAGLAVGLVSCKTEPEGPWGKSSGICFNRHVPPSYSLQVREFDNAVLMYLRADPEQVCGASVMYKDNTAQLLDNVEDFDAEMVRMLYGNTVRGYTLVDSNCDKKVEAYINNNPRGVQSILARDQEPRRFEGEFDPLLRTIEQKTVCTSKK